MRRELRWTLVIGAVLFGCGLTLTALPAGAQAAEKDCVACHQKTTPGIVAQFQAGPEGHRDEGCQACHGEAHWKGAEDAALAAVPTPDTCATCHEEQVAQYKGGKHALAWAAMEAMPMFAHQPFARTPKDDLKACSGCHKVGLRSPEKKADVRYGTGACDSCHTRHTFSVKEAKDPRACMTCHMGFDHPQWEMWSTSKHGAIWQMEGDTGRAPTCQDCHMQDGHHGVMTGWGFLAVRLPLPEDPQWKADRITILQGLGVLDAAGNPTPRIEAVKAAKVARLTEEDFQAQRTKMLDTCSQCHARSYAETHLRLGDQTIQDADRLMAEAIRVVSGLYADGVLQKPEGWTFAPDLLQFYESPTAIEQELWTMFLEYRMRAFQGAFHMNPDYMHWYGWAEMKRALAEIKEEAHRLRVEKGHAGTSL